MLVWLVCKYEVHVNIATACLLALTHMRLNVPLGKFPEARLRTALAFDRWDTRSCTPTTRHTMSYIAKYLNKHFPTHRFVQQDAPVRCLFCLLLVFD
jgi:hypothetical protein